jgi:hypothetical protein
MAKINANEAKAASPDQAFLDKAVDDIATIARTLTTSLSQQLSANGYDKIRTIVKLDNPKVKDDDRKAFIEAAAPAEAAALLSQARAELGRVVNYTQASALGLDSARVSVLLDQELKRELEAAVAGSMTQSHQEVVRLRSNYTSTLKAEVNKIARDVAYQVAVDVTKDDNRELRSLLKTRKTHMPQAERERLIDQSAETKAIKALPAAVRELETRVPSSQTTAAGLDPIKEREAFEAALKTAIKAQIKDKLTAGYDQLCDESREHAEARADFWGRAKLIAPAALLVATGATILAIGGTSHIFWGPVGAVAMAAAFGFCRWRQGSARANHLD